MKGLIRQDMTVLFSKNTIYTISILLFLLVALSVGGMGVFAVTLPVVIITKFGVNAFHYESRSQWNKFTCALPISRRRIVLARYATAMLLTLLGVIISGLYALLLHMVHYDALKPLFGPVAVALAFAWLSISVSFPLLYKFGAERANNSVSILSFVEYIILVLIFQFLPISRLEWVFVAVAIVSLGCLFVSCYVSMRIYQAKDIG